MDCRTQRGKLHAIRLNKIRIVGTHMEASTDLMNECAPQPLPRTTSRGFFLSTYIFVRNRL
jgi:hypothetical protein